MTSKPRECVTVSVLMPAYNHERYVRQAIESVWRQTFRDLELIVIDDGSTDGTGAIAQSLAARSPVPMSVVRRENRGICKTLNEALQMSSGKWVALLASDDWYLPEFIRRSHDAAREAPDAAVAVHSDALMVGDDGEAMGIVSRVSPRAPIAGRDAFRALVAGDALIVSPTLFVSSRILREVGGFDERMAAEDFDLHLRLARKVPFVFLDEPLYCSRVARGSLGRRPWVWARDIIRALEKHADVLGADMPRILQGKCIELSDACFSHGAPRHGLLWAREALRHSGTDRWRAAAVLANRGVAGTVRYLCVRLLPVRAITWIRGIKARLKAIGRRPGAP